MINTNIIDGLSIYTISDMFVAKINEPGVIQLGDDFFVVHDCIHFFSGLGVSVAEERLIKEIQEHMLYNKVPSNEARPYIFLLMKKGVFKDLKQALLESKEQFDNLLKAI